MQTTQNQPSGQRKRHPRKKADVDLPGSDTMSRISDHEPNALPSGRQYADNPSQHPPFHSSPDNKPSKSFRPAEILGWGTDLDRSKRPGYPKERRPARENGSHWDQPEGQVPGSRVFHSTERPGITPVFGTSVAPRGVSGWIRQAAYGLSENDIRHWLMLLLSDRIDMVEGIIDDLRHGHVPNPVREMGWTAMWKHNRKALARKASFAAAVVSIPLALYFKSRRERAYVTGLHGA